MATVRELVTRLRFDVDPANLKKYGKATDDIKKSAESAAISFRNIFAAFAGAQAIRGIVSVADSMQSLRARIGQLPQTLGDAGDAMDVVGARAINAKQSIDAYAGFYIKAGQATKDFVKDQEQLLKIVDGAAFGLAASGATAVLQGQAFFQLGQAIGSPTVQMEEMNTLIDAAPELWRALGDVIVGTGKNFKQEISKGNVTGKMLAEGLEKVAPAFEKRMREIPNTVEQAIQRVQSKWALFVDRINRKSMFITKTANAINDAFDAIIGTLETVTEKLGGAENAVKLLGIAFGVVLAMMLPGWVAIAAATLAATWPVLALFAALLLCALALEDFLGWMDGSDSLFGRFFGNIEEYRANIESLNNVLMIASVAALAFWAGLLSPVIIVATAIYAVIVAAMSLYEHWDTVMYGIGKIAGEVWDGIVANFMAAIADIKSAWNGVKSFFGFGTTINAPNAVGAGTVASATAAGGGVPMASGGQTNNITVQAAPGTPEANKEAARAGTVQALDEAGKAARQMGQAQ
jgi:tape measure domain-containing protein